MVKRIVIRLAVGGVVVVLLAACVYLFRVNRFLDSQLFDQQYLTLSPEDCKSLISDIASGDSNRLAGWSLYFQHELDLHYNLKENASGLDYLFALYQKHEQPGRSNYFGDLVNGLTSRQLTVGMDTNTLFKYLGKPDYSGNTTNGRFFQYKFSLFGKSEVAFVVASNETVITIGVADEVTNK